MASFGEVLRSVMEQKNVKNQDLATVLRKTDGTVSHLVTGRTKSIDYETSKLIAQALDTPESFWFDLKQAEKSGSVLPTAHYMRELGYTSPVTITPGILVDYQVLQLIDEVADLSEDQYTDDTFIVDPFDRNSLKAASYDTHIGGYWEGLPSKSRPYCLEGGATFSVPAGATKYVHSREHFRMPVNMVGRLGPTVELIKKGFIVSHGPLIAPLYSGRLTVALQNFSDEDVTISSDLRFMKVIFEQLQATPESRERTSDLLNGNESEAELLERERALIKELAELREAKRHAKP